jgi:hypothetical protein
VAFSYVLVIKLVLAPMLVAAATSAGYRFGPKVTGWLAGFPAVAGPIVLLFVLEQGPEFAAKAAESSLLGVASLVGFCVMYLMVARSHSWLLSMLCGWIFYACATYLLQKLNSPWWLNAIIALAAVKLGSRLLARPHTPLLPRTVKVWDIPARMAATAFLVVLLTKAASGLGSQLSGLLTPFPVVTTIIAVFAQREQGYAGALRTLQGLLASMPAFVTFCLVLAITLVPLGPWLGFASAIAANLALQLLALTELRRGSENRAS